jgi:hypothetical protein
MECMSNAYAIRLHSMRSLATTRFMLLSSQPRRHQAPHVTVLELQGLAELRRPEVNLVLWPRPTDPWMTGLSALFERDASGSLCLDAPTSALDPLFAPFARLLAAPTLQLLRRDVGLLVGALFRAIRPAHVDVSLAVVRDDACRKFHVDRRHARMLCTYAGPGTHWVPNHAVDRAALADDRLDVARANAAIVPDPREIRSMPSPWVALLKGAAWPGNEQHGLVHRSPPLAATGLCRLVLTADAHAR